jgi:hypothetical protein
MAEKFVEEEEHRLFAAFGTVRCGVLFMSLPK